MANGYDYDCKHLLKHHRKYSGICHCTYLGHELEQVARLEMVCAPQKPGCFDANYL